MDIVSIEIRKTGGSVARPPRPHLAEDKSIRNYDFVTETAYAATATGWAAAPITDQWLIPACGYEKPSP